MGMFYVKVGVRSRLIGSLCHAHRLRSIQWYSAEARRMYSFTINAEGGTTHRGVTNHFSQIKKNVV